MIKTLQTVLKQDKEVFHIPRSVQEALPVSRLWPDGIFLAGGKYSRSYCFSDINFAVASKEDKEAMFLDYSELLNVLDAGSTAKITINNRRLNRRSFEQDILIPLAGDELDKYRREYNQAISDKTIDSHSILQEKYLTISVARKTVEEARSYFARIGADISAHFARMSSRCSELNSLDRLRIFHDFYRPGEESEFHFDFSETMRKGHSFKDFICPDTLEFERDCFRMGDKYGRVLFLREYANYIKDSMITELCDLPRNLMLSIDIIPIPTDEAVREIENKLLGVETNITNWQRKQNNNNNFSAVIPYDMELQRRETKEFLSDLTTRDQRMMFGLVTLVHLADTKKQLDADTDTLLAVARKNLCQMSALHYQQMEGLSTALPFGVRKVDALRTLTTESTAVLIPFRAQELIDRGGIFYGINAVSRNPIIGNKANLLNGNGFRLGVPGSGKSFGTKEELVYLALATNDDILVCDPENEYSLLVEALGGEVVRIEAGSPNHINAMDMVQGYGGKDPIIDKSEFILSLFEQVTDHLGAKEKSLLDRCTASVYRNYQRGGPLPRLPVLREELLAQAEPEAQELALAAELFTNGSLDTFAYATNVDIGNRIVSYNIRGLGKQLKTLGLLIITDAMINRVTENWAMGRRTHIFLDEFHVVFENAYSEAFFTSAWRQFRKRNALVTGITQNVEFLLASETARFMLSNSEFVVMYNQAASDRAELAKLLNISSQQLSYITNVESGHGLMRFGRFLIPFIDDFPKATELFKLMNTKPGES